jgi:hypothetical protein
VRALNPEQRVQVIGLAPGEPAAKLVGVEGVRVPGIPGQLRDRRELCRCHRAGLEREGASCFVMAASGDLETMPRQRTAVHGEAT